MKIIKTIVLVAATFIFVAGCELFGIAKEQLMRIAKDGTGAGVLNEVVCRVGYSSQEEIDYSNTDAFDCQLRKSQDSNLQSVKVNFPSEAEYNVTPKDASGVSIPLYVPDRAAAWVAFVKASDGGIVWKCKDGGPESFPWALVTKNAIEFFLDRYNSDKAKALRLYGPANNYHVKIQYQSDAGASQLTTTGLEFVRRGLGDPARAESCTPDA